MADRHMRMCGVLRDVLECEHDIDVIAEAHDLDAVTSLLRVDQPQVLVLDARLHDGSTLDGIKRLREQAPRTQIVLITMDNNRPLAERALTAGVLGFVLKDSADSELCTAVRAAASCQRYTSPRVNQA